MIKIGCGISSGCRRTSDFAGVSIFFSHMSEMIVVEST